MSKVASQDAVVLIGHGAPATDCPPEWIGELMSLEWRRGGGPHQHPSSGRAAELDAKIRNWPRQASNDPYKVGVERLAEAVRSSLPDIPVVVAYNEFCRPSIAEAVASAVQQGATRLFVIPTMLTPGGIHSERDIPRALEALRRTQPSVQITYLWPFDLAQVASLLAAQIRQAISQPASTSP